MFFCCPIFLLQIGTSSLINSLVRTIRGHGISLCYMWGMLVLMFGKKGSKREDDVLRVPCLTWYPVLRGTLSSTCMVLYIVVCLVLSVVVWA